MAKKKSYGVFAGIYAIFIAVFMALFLILPRIGGIGWMKFMAVPYFALVIPFVVIWCRVRSQLKTIMSDVEKVCQQHSESDSNSSNNGFRYTLQSEHWGACSKPHVKRYFITVHAPGGTKVGNNADIEQPVSAVATSTPVATYVPTPAAPLPSNEVFQDTPFSEAATSGGNGNNKAGKSIFDQLSGK